MVSLSQCGQGALAVIVVVVILMSLLILYFNFNTESGEVIQNGFHTQAQ